MRAKQLAAVLPLNKVKLIWERLTFSRLTTAYFIFSVIHCIVQVSLQIRAFTINRDAASFLYSISVQANATDNRVPVIANGNLNLCSQVPTHINNYGGCQVIWNGTAKSNVVADSNAPSYSSAQLTTDPASSTTVVPVSSTSSTPASSITSSSASSTTLPAQVQVAPVVITQTITPTVTIIVTPTDVVASEDDGDTDNLDLHVHRRFSPKAFVFDEDGTTEVIITGDGFDNVKATLTESCLWSLNWPVATLDNTKREDIVFISFQFWVLGMSIVALLNESLPHMVASLLTHVLATAWAGIQLHGTADFHSTFTRVITDGACNGVGLLPEYWDQRAAAEYPSLVFNAIALLVSAFLSWRLFKSFGWQTFKRIGASLTINRVYKLVLVLSIVLQLSFFFMTVTVGLWLDSLFNGVAAQEAAFVVFYKTTSFVALLLMIPWIMTGWHAVRREIRTLMFIFLLLSLLYLAAWGSMFLADTFRWLFLTWTFFTLMATASVLFTLMAFVLGVVCRYNFGKGLLRYLNAQEPLPGDDFTPVNSADVEKIAFPSNEKPIPTFSVTFGSGSQVPPPSQMFSGRLGPRFFNPSAEPFEPPRDGSPISAPSPALTRTPSQSSSGSSKRWLLE